MRPNRGWAVALTGLLVSGCMGDTRTLAGGRFDENGNPVDENGNPIPGEPGSDSGSGGIPSGPSACETPPAPGAAYLRRLTNSEYLSAVKTLTAWTDAAPPVDVSNFPADPVLGGFAFTNHADALALSQAHIESYLSAAEAIGLSVVNRSKASAAVRTAVIGCDPPTGGAACLNTFIKGFGRKAFRRPLEQVELDELTALAATVTYPYERINLVTQQLLLSPSFLFRVDRGAADPSRPGQRKLTGYEVAARLSFLLYGTTPDAPLLDEAAKGTFDTAAGVAAHAAKMIDDPRARAALAGFYRQWLKLTNLAGAQIDPAVYTQWTPALAASMAEETSRLVDDAIYRSGANFLDILTARHSFLDGPLATLYGVPAPATPFGRVELPASSHRQGLLTHASFLTSTSSNNEASPILRGKFVRELLLCLTLPPPPASVPALPAPDPSVTERERMALHRVPECAGCHVYLEPTGFAMEHFDAIGGYHEKDPQGRTLTATGTLQGFTPAEFVGPEGLGEKLRGSPQFAECVVKQTLRFAYGRLENASDACTLEKANAAFRSSGYNFREMVKALVGSDGFRYVGGGT